MATIDDFMKLDMRVGTVLKAAHLSGAKIPAITMDIDFGDEIGIKASSAQVTQRYEPGTLIGEQVVAIINFPPRKIAGFTSEVLVIGGVPEKGDVVLLKPEMPLPNGTTIS
ncbi:chaperone CsaA [Salicibibacter kimchii]|uniref:tRNA-binding protein n=1 Tax=Salicibibacter kimchii TaxID=2099786 RepID=A0A345C2Q1_9BACI|nr:chaperone CsaA [Salicibibacter kimchii]AXF57482.1 tRNA-binding protein [Salicibibacter kimchii]